MQAAKAEQDAMDQETHEEVFLENTAEEVATAPANFCQELSVCIGLLCIVCCNRTSATVSASK